MSECNCLTPCNIEWADCPKRKSSLVELAATKGLVTGDKVNELKDEIARLKSRIEWLEKPPKFPTVLRKMWSGAEVQQWLNEHYAATTEKDDG